MTDMGRDAQGYLVARNDVMDVRLTECCHATAKGTDDGIACRNCYRLIDPLIGGMPVAPYTLDGAVTATEVYGWDGWPETKRAIIALRGLAGGGS
jgi:hypothetical protein